MSLKKIAELTGTSVATVSRVLNNPEYHCHDEALTKRIRETAKKLNYTPNDSARALKQSQTSILNKQYCIDILLARFDHMEKDSFFAEIYRYIEAELYMQGYSVGNMLTMRDVSELTISPRNKLRDGLVILGKCPEIAVDTVKRAYKAVVAIDRNPMEYKMDEVTCSGAKAAQMAVEYLIELGHSKIGYIGDCTMEARYYGYHETLLNHKLAISYDYILSTNQTREEGYQAFHTLSSLRVPPTAIFCANDITALGFIKAMKETNGRKKKNIYHPAIISIDDIEEASAAHPMLTTIQIPKSDMVHMAILTLKDRLDGHHKECIRLELPCHLVVRETSGMYIN